MRSAAILDLDATLVNTFGDERDWSETEGEDRNPAKQRIFNLCVDKSMFMWGTKRPYAKEFLRTCFENFDIVDLEFFIFLLYYSNS